MRPGHHRPLGTTTTMNFRNWTEEREPQLLDIIRQVSAPGADDADYIQRAYEVVGVWELPTGYRLTCERVAYDTIPASHDPDALWHFYHEPRPHRL
jgi:hypothetical protein